MAQFAHGIPPRWFNQCTARAVTTNLRFCNKLDRFVSVFPNVQMWIGLYSQGGVVSIANLGICADVD